MNNLVIPKIFGGGGFTKIYDNIFLIKIKLEQEILK